MLGLKFKQFVLMLLRVTGLMGVADKILLVLHIWRNAGDNRAYRSDSFIRNKLLTGFEEATLMDWPSFHQELYCARQPAAPVDPS